MKIIAHRGASGYAPENTLKAFGKALDLGASWIELDVYRIENELLVFHDERLERTTNGGGYLWDHPLGYLRGLDAGEGEKIPFLEEVMELVGEKACINIELKGPFTAGKVGRMIEALVEGGTRDYHHFLVSSFNHHLLREMQTRFPRIPRGALVCGIPLDYCEFAEQLGASAVNLSLDFIDADIVADAHSRGMEVLVYTANHPEDIRRMARLGVDGVFSDFPDRNIPAP